MPRHPDEVHMSFGDHLEELRRRLLYAIAGLGLVCCVTFYYGEKILFWLYIPLRKAQIANQMDPYLIEVNPAGAFTTYMKVSIIAAVIIAAPWILYQIWRFIEAGLYPAERKVVLVLVPFSTLMVFGGISFFYWVMLPLCMDFLIAFFKVYPEDMLKPMIEASKYISFVVFLALGILVAFQLPVVMVMAGMAGIVDARWLATYRRHALIACLVVAALLTPTTDPFNMAVLFVPLYLLYEVGVVLVWLIGKRKKVADAEG